MKRGRNFWADREWIGRKFIAVLLMGILLLESMAPVPAEAADGFELSTKIIYKWKRLSYNDIDAMSEDEECRVAIVTRKGKALLDTGRCDMGSFPLACRELTDTDYPGLSSDGDTLYTAQNIGLVKMKRMENDSDNDDRPKIRFQTEHNNKWLSVMKYPEKDAIMKLNYRFGYTDNPRVTTSLVSDMTVWQGYDSSCVKLQYNIPKGYSDEYIWTTDDGKLFTHSNSLDKYVKHKFEKSDNDQSDVRIYKVTQEKWSCMAQDYEVASGQTLKLNGKVYIDKGKTLTVAEDAVLLLDGTVMYDGSIKNKGTTVLQPNAVLQPLTSSTSLGNFTCNGGDLLVTKNAKILCKQGLVLDSGSSCINFGIVMVPTGFSMNNAYFDNRSGGTLVLGYDIYPSEFARGTLDNEYVYSGSWQMGEITSGEGKLMVNRITGNYEWVNKWELSHEDRIPQIDILGNSKLINQGVVKRCTRLNKASDAVFKSQNDGKDLNYNDKIKLLEEYSNKLYGPGKWYWSADGKIESC